VQRSVLVLALVVVLAFRTAALAGTGDEPGPPVLANPGPASPAPSTTCDLIEIAAAADDLPVEYFTRLIWTESSFRAEVVSPKGAQGIAQFMPATAAERGLADPFDPYQAIPASAKLLKDLAQRFGNLGLAAAAYNSGPRRVEEWLAGTGGLPQETQAYVAAITGRAAEDWRSLSATDEPIEAQSQTGPTSCVDVLAALNATPRATALQASQAQAPWQPWGVQLAANFSQSIALASYRRLQDRYPTVLGDRAPLVLRKVNLSFGRSPMVHIVVPAPTRQAANDLCNQLRTKGGSCIVLKN
jgi:hypothetical protein